MNVSRSAPTNDTHPMPPGARPRRWLIRLGVALIVFCLAFYGGGGWYFSSQLGDDAFAVQSPEDPRYGIEVDSVSTRTITLVAEAASEPHLATDGVTGFAHAGGQLRLGMVIANITDGTQDIVTRRYDVIMGSAPVAGDRGDLDPWLYPDNRQFRFGAPMAVTYESDLGPMDARYVPNPATTWIVLIHGKGATERETYRMIDAVGPHPVLAISYRNDPGQPRDPSGRYRYGATEWRDVEGAVAYAIDHGAENVVLAGFSTGAALSLSFMYQSDLADRVVGLMFDAPNIDFGRTVDFEASQRTLPWIGTQVPQSLTTVAKFLGGLRFGVDWSRLDYIDDIDRIEVPILVFHGTEDTTVPIDVSERLAMARPDLVSFLAFEGAGHVQSWNTDPARYDAAVGRFLDQLARLASS